MLIQRDWNRKEDEDFALRVRRHLDATTRAWPQRDYNNVITGWVVKSAFE